MKAHLYAASVLSILALAACGNDNESGISDMSEMDDSAAGDAASNTDSSVEMSGDAITAEEPASAPASMQASGVNESDPATRFAGICTSLLDQTADACTCIYDRLETDQTAYLTASYTGDTEGAAAMAVDYEGDMHADTLDAFEDARQSCAS
ncbi:hypothetical protein [Euryhalocaulis caribicus]|uniref:hypothetical protein n=1 Tax=Euryhalocaulis caribicus TaxID=1161401 RepID=UPI00039C4BA2|nr:hypothetical protein [Euryhalocaulis caribicus]